MANNILDIEDAFLKGFARWQMAQAEIQADFLRPLAKRILRATYHAMTPEEKELYDEMYPGESQILKSTEQGGI